MKEGQEQVRTLVKNAAMSAEWKETKVFLSADLYLMKFCTFNNELGDRMSMSMNYLV